MHDWNGIVATLGPRLKSYFCRSFSDFLAADCTQETLIRLVRKVQSKNYFEEKGSLCALAYGIAFNVKREAKKALKNEVVFIGNYLTLQSTSIDDTPEDDAMQKERSDRLKKAIQQLSDVEQDILNLYLEKDLSMQDIAGILQLPEGTIKSHMHRAKETLKKKLSVIQSAR